MPPPPPVCAITFTDVPAASPFSDFIRCLTCRGIVGGYSDGTFRPGAAVTRGQHAKFVANAAGYTDAVPSTRQTFVDVPPSQPFRLYIERVAVHGVLSGYSDGTLRAGPTSRGARSPSS
ncbi:MAG TPA: S-layer homology domain-containing protein [Chloroflexia bacterium]|jgi:5'-nucleotidase/2',3'-cyclic-nucleotide 2'-phosphodiesterase/3'-nucleotidase/5'-nucleotidase|nr:S-layer homology domain-containing protein [Chloroflexia bacterium]